MRRRPLRAFALATPAPDVYLREPRGVVHRGDGRSLDTCVVGPYLFYEADPCPVPGQPRTVELRAPRFRDMTSVLLESGKPGRGVLWGGGFAAPAVERTSIAYRDNILTEPSPRDWATIVRVYRVE